MKGRTRRQAVSSLVSHFIDNMLLLLLTTCRHSTRSLDAISKPHVYVSRER